jgi:hypothetical protein
MWRRLVSLYMRVTGRRYWQAVSPYSSLQLGLISTKEAVRTVKEMGRVSFVDVKNGTIIFDAHLVPQQNQERQ